MAIFMPLDSNLPQFNLNNILKFQTPTQIFQHFMNKRDSEGPFAYSNENVRDNCNIMTETEKHKPLSIHLDVINNPEDSCNSTDSDLSVGQEKIDDDQTESETVENPMSGVMEEEDSSNASSSNFLNNPARQPRPHNSSLDNPLQLKILRPSPSKLHEELFRSSQIYAEELVRQQLAAAARLQSLSGSKGFAPQLEHSAFSEKQRLLLNSTGSEIDPSLGSKLSFQSNVFAPKTIDNNQNGNNLFCNNKSAINFQNIHSHLSAISQITNNLTSSIKKDDTTSLSSLSRESSQSPSNFQHLKQHHHQNMIFHTQQNQLHERNLKFSIDNILKADFGRRITEPLLRTSKQRKSKQDKDPLKKFNAPVSLKESFNSCNDIPRVSESSPSNESPSSSEQGKSESKKGSGSGTVWPAWVS